MKVPIERGGVSILEELLSTRAKIYSPWRIQLLNKSSNVPSEVKTCYLLRKEKERANQ